jgi:hypothetical protein
MIAAIALAAALGATGPACATPLVPIPAHEPTLTAGPSELVAGIYEQGGALIPNCPQRARGPYAGTLTITSVRTGRVVARRTLHSQGRLFVVRLAPGRYRLSGQITGGPLAVRETVTIPARTTVRQDLFVDLP